MKQKLQELYTVKRSIESVEFQTYIMKPLFEELEKLKNAYDCKTLQELSFLKGKKEGLETIIEILKIMEVDIKNTKFEIESSEEDSTR